MTVSGLELSRTQILAHRRRVSALDERLLPGAQSLEHAAWAGLQDSMPRAALLSIHARVAGAEPNTWEHPALIQVWGPRFSAYVVAARDRAVFTLGRLPEDARGLGVATDLAARLEALLAGRRMTHGEAERGLGEPNNRLRYAAPTGTVVMRWDGARQPVIWSVAPPEMEPRDARLELVRRYLHVFGPTTPVAFAEWAGIGPAQGRAAFEALAGELTPVTAPLGETWILGSDEASLRAATGPAAPARLLPSGDTYFLLKGRDRELLVPDVARHSLLWTPRVWPGAVIVAGEVAGTWRRAQHIVTIRPWRALSGAERAAVEAEAVSLPLPGLRRPIAVRWDE